MKSRTHLLITLSFLILTLSACSSEKPKGAILRSPASIRGWIAEIELPDTGYYKLRSATTGAADAKMELFRETTVVVDGYQFASGGVAEYGSFIVLDVPPGDVTLTFTAPTVNDVKLALKGVPANADIVIPGLLLTKQGVKIHDPSKVLVRVPNDEKVAPGAVVNIGGVDVPVKPVPFGELSDRREWPTPERIR